jgi:hypothetical protein
MLFKCDENLPHEVAGLLRHRGHDALTVKEEQLDGRSTRRLRESVLKKAAY